MHDADPHVRPRRPHGGGIVDAQVGEGQDGADEVGRLLVQVVEVLRGPLDVRRQHLLHARGGEGRVRGDFVFGEGGEAFGVHPAFHDEGPEVKRDLQVCVLVDVQSGSSILCGEGLIEAQSGLCNSFEADRCPRAIMGKDVLFNRQYCIRILLNRVSTITTHPKARARAPPHQPAQC